MKTYYIAARIAEDSGFDIVKTFDLSEARRKTIADIEHLTDRERDNTDYWAIEGYTVPDSFDPAEDDIYDLIADRDSQEPDEQIIIGKYHGCVNASGAPDTEVIRRLLVDAGRLDLDLIEAGNDPDVEGALIREAARRLDVELGF